MGEPNVEKEENEHLFSVCDRLPLHWCEVARICLRKIISMHRMSVCTMALLHRYLLSFVIFMWENGCVNPQAEVGANVNNIKACRDFLLFLHVHVGRRVM